MSSVFDFDSCKRHIWSAQYELFENDLTKLPEPHECIESDFPELLRDAATKQKQGGTAIEFKYLDQLVQAMGSKYDKEYVQTILNEVITGISPQSSSSIYDDIVDAFIEYVPEVCWRIYNPRQRTPILVAVQQLAVDIVYRISDICDDRKRLRALLSFAADGKTTPIVAALQRALLPKHEEAAVKLDEKPQISVFRREWARHSFVELESSGRHADILNVLMEQSNAGEVDKRKWELLALIKNREIIQYLIEQHIKVNLQPSDAFVYVAIKNREVGLLKTLLCKDIFPDMINHEHLSLTMEPKDTLLFELIHKYRPKVIDDLKNPKLLHNAVQCRNVTVVRAILARKQSFALEKVENRYALSHLNPARHGQEQRRLVGEPRDLRKIHRSDTELQEWEDIRCEILNALMQCGVSPKQIKDVFLDSKVDVAALSLNLSIFDNNNLLFENFLAMITADTENGYISNNDLYRPRFESTLAYFCSPDFDLIRRDNTLSLKAAHDQRQKPLLSKLFKWLRQHSVKRILELKVNDSMLQPHSEEEIEELVRDFQPKRLDWKRLDISIFCIKEGLPDVEELVLYSSCDWAAVSHWFGKEGIVELKKLRKLELVLISDLVTQGRRQEIQSYVRRKCIELYNEQELLQEQLEITDPRISFWASERSVLDPAVELVDRRDLARDLTGVREFFHWFNVACHHNLSSPAHRKVKVAILDNGFEFFRFRANLAEGHSFVFGRRDQEMNWFIASDLHGTQMASLVVEMNPQCQLYLIKVGSTEHDITADSVEQGLLWAIQKGVDVISMSFAILGDKDGKIQSQVTRAHQKNIVVFASTAHGARMDEEWFPARCVGCIPVAACDRSGTPLSGNDGHHAEYYFPGTFLRGPSVSYLKVNEGISGSSVATAIAAGIASLIIACGLMLDEIRHRDDKPRMIKAVFNQMKTGNSKAVNPAKFFSNDRMEFSDGIKILNSKYKGSHRAYSYKYVHETVVLSANHISSQQKLFNKQTFGKDITHHTWKNLA